MKVLLMLTTFNIKEIKTLFLIILPSFSPRPVILSPFHAGILTGLILCGQSQLLWIHASNGPVTSQRNCFTSQSLDSYHPSVPLPNSPWALAREACYWYHKGWTFQTDFLSSQTNSPVKSGSCTSLWAQRYEFRGQCDVYWLNTSSGFPLGLMSFSSHDLGQIHSTRLMFPPLEQVLSPARDWSANSPSLVIV